MGRPPCCDKVGIKKGPWTPEEDIILVTYIQDHGPGNWRSVPTNTGLMRCSKSCRLRWTNYLRPGIKRGNFTPHEEGIIIHLQASLGNRWAAIASYLPQRTDNDIKNYWNTHLKKKIDKYQPVMDLASCSKSSNTGCHDFMPPNLGKSDLRTSYASSTENISKLLEGWMSSFRKDNVVTQGQDKQHEATNIALRNSSTVSSACFKAKQIKNEGETCCGSIEELESLLLINNSSSIEWAKSQPEEAFLASDTAFPDHSDHEDKRLETQHLPLTLLEDWLLDEVTGQEDLLELSAEYSSV